ncbi:MAG: hypothetical protein HY900_23355 [Deltaproteobacteria bacterium]|nr:hypothetical protein [Deltaproteobacteria bacterium]
MYRERNRLLARVFERLPALGRLWSRTVAADRGEVGWTQPRKRLREAVVAVITTGGVHLKEQVPFDMEDPRGDPSYRAFPADVSPDALTITHDYYHHEDADRDLNLVLPLERLRELERAGALRLHPTAYSFMGHIDGEHVETLRARTAPEVAARLAEAGADYALLVPA